MGVELSQSERIRRLVKWLAKERKVPQRDIAKLMGYNNGASFSQVINGMRKLPPAFIPRLASLDPRINIEFLEGTSDEMLLGDAENPASEHSQPWHGYAETQYRRPAGIFVPPELAQMVTEMTTIIRDQQAMIHTFVDAWVKCNNNNN